MKMYPPMSELHARAIVTFVEEVESRGAASIIAHCEQGVSRSAAVAKWIADTRGLTLDATTLDYHNTYVYRLLSEVTL